MKTLTNNFKKLDLTEKIGLTFATTVILPLLSFIVVNMINGNFQSW